MSASTPEFWAQMSEGFQQNLSKSWGQAMQHFQTIDLGGLKAGADTAALLLVISVAVTALFKLGDGADLTAAAKGFT